MDTNELDKADGGAGTPATADQLAARYETLRQKYDLLWSRYQLLSNSKLGKATLWYWRKKDRLRAKMWSAFAKKHLPPIQDEAQLPSISVVIPTYRQNPYFQEAVCSVLGQDYPKGKIRILVSVNGENAEYFQQLTETYRDCGQLRVLYTKKQSVGAARNLAISAADTECVCFLDDDDMFTPGYLRLLAVHMHPDVTIVCGPLEDYRMDTRDLSPDTYINRTIDSVGAGAYRRYLPLAPLLSSLPAKLYRTKLLREAFSPLDEELQNTEDVVFWAENYHAIHGSVFLCGKDAEEYYIRRLTPGSLSRPLDKDRIQFYIQDRLAVLERLEGLRERASSKEERQFIQSKISRQQEFMRNCLVTLTDDEKAAAAVILKNSALKSKTDLLKHLHEEQP